MPENQVVYTYRNGQKVPLEKREDQFVVRALPATLERVGIPDAEQVSSASSRVTAPPARREAMMAAAGSVGRIDPAYYQITTGEEFLATDRIFVTFHEPPTPAQLDALMNRYALFVAERYSDRDFLMQMSPNTPMDPVELVVKLMEDEDLVALADHDLNYRATRSQAIPPTDPSYLQEWHLHTHFSHPDFDPRSSARCEEAWQILGGYGSAEVVVGVADDGCRLDHGDFDSPGKFANWGYFKGTRLVTRDDIDADPAMMYQTGANHGTSCAGVIAGEADAALTVGAAPGCRLLPVKWESNGPYLLISDSKLLSALNFIADKADILSNSWGVAPVSTHAGIVTQRIRQLTETGGRRGRGILFLWAAGNDNCPIQHVATIDVPYTTGRGDMGQWVGVETARIFRNDLVDIPGVIHVAALASTAQRSHYSNYGTGISLCAPTNNVHLYRRLVVAGLGITTTTGTAAGVTGSFGGTSSATPLVAGIAALVLSANANLTALELEAILKRTASKDLSMEGYPKTPPAPYDLNPTWDVSPIAPFDSGAFTDTGDPNGTWSPWFGHGRADAPGAVAAALALLGGELDEISASSAPNLDIPDNTPAGVQDVISVSEAGRVAAITVDVDIAHTWIGDLLVTLVAPDGTAAVLHNRGGGNADNIRQTWTLESLPVLGGLVDKPVTGPWTLKVADLGRRDTGTLRTWALRIRMAPARLAAADEAAMAIPDNRPAGVTRSLALDGGQAVQELAVSVDISHTWIGDLRVTLTSPQGTAVVLHNQAGGSADNLIRTWRSQDDAGLRVLRGQAVAGDWKLTVADLAAQDVGKLNRWALDVTP